MNFKISNIKPITIPIISFGYTDIANNQSKPTRDLAFLLACSVILRIICFFTLRHN